MVVEVLDYFNIIMKMFAEDNFYLATSIICVIIMLNERCNDNCYAKLISLLMVALINPITLWLANKVLFNSDNRTVKLLMAIPIFIPISYIIVKNTTKWYHFVASLCLIVLFGTNILTSNNFEKATNWYKLNQSTINVCDYLESQEDDNDEQIYVLAEGSLSTYIRQYDARIVLLLGRWEFMEMDTDTTTIRYQMQIPTVDTKILTNLIKNERIDYIIFPEDRAYTEPLDQYGWRKKAVVDGYIIWRNLETEN